MAQQLGGAIGLAAIATVAAAATRAAGGGIAGGTHGIHVAFLVTLCLPLMAAGITVFALQNPTPSTTAVEGERKVLHLSTTDPVPVVALPIGDVSDASVVSRDANRLPNGSLPLEEYDDEGGDLAAPATSRSKDRPSS
jgi:hypothetical protein